MVSVKPNSYSQTVGYFLEVTYYTKFKNNIKYETFQTQYP